jgi:hypothetical protein
MLGKEDDDADDECACNNSATNVAWRRHASESGTVQLFAETDVVAAAAAGEDDDE